MTVPNAFSDLRRRIFFATRELMLQGRSLDGYQLVVSRDMYAKAINEASAEMRRSHFADPEHLFGLPLVLSDTRQKGYVALVHEVMA